MTGLFILAFSIAATSVDGRASSWGCRRPPRHISLAPGDICAPIPCGGSCWPRGVRVIAPVQRAWRIRRVPGCRTPERETQNCGDGQFSADRAAWEWRDYGSETGGISRRKWPGRCLPIGFQITYIILFQYITRIQFTRIGHPIIKVTV